MPIIGNEDQVAVAIGCAPAGHMPHGLQRRLAQQRTPEGDGQPLPCSRPEAASSLILPMAAGICLA